MSVATNPRAITPETFNDYYGRIQEVRRLIKLRGRGTQNDMAHDFRVQQTRISFALSCRMVDIEILAMMEDWLGVTPSAKAV